MKKELTQKPTSSVIGDDEILNAFCFVSEIREEFCLSALVFHIDVEFPANAIRHIEETKAIQFGREEVNLPL